MGVGEGGVCGSMQNRGGGGGEKKKKKGVVVVRLTSRVRLFVNS